MHCSSQALLLGIKLDLQAQHISNGLSRFFLCRGGDVGVGVQGEACGEVAEHAGYRLDIHAVLEGNGSKGVAEIMESDLWDASPFEDTLEHIVDAIWGDGSAVGGRKHILVMGLGFLLFENFYRLL